MSGEFRTPPEELRHLLDQIGELKASLREIAGRVSQIERHVRRAFQVPKGHIPAAPRARPTASLPPPTLSPSEVLRVFDELGPLLDSGGREAVEQRLSSIEIPDLRLMVHELGAPMPSKPSRKGLVAAILGRANESLLLSRNRNVVPPRAQGPDAPEPPKKDEPG